jgi:hypothetical protein
VWVPSRDSGIDLLVTNRTNQRAVSLQVKFSRDFLVTHMPAHFQKPLRACGWWSLNRKKIAALRADYWVFTLIGFATRSTDFILVPRAELLSRLDKIHGRVGWIDLYFWVTEKKRCWATRNAWRPCNPDSGLGILSPRKHDQLVLKIANVDFRRILSSQISG